MCSLSASRDLKYKYKLLTLFSEPIIKLTILLKNISYKIGNRRIQGNFLIQKKVLSLWATQQNKKEMNDKSALFWYDYHHLGVKHSTVMEEKLFYPPQTI